MQILASFSSRSLQELRKLSLLVDRRENSREVRLCDFFVIVYCIVLPRSTFSHGRVIWRTAIDNGDSKYKHFLGSVYTDRQCAKRTFILDWYNYNQQ